MAQYEDRRRFVEKSVHEILSPLGFKKQKSNWRRALPEVLQQFTIASMRIGAKYRPEWGLNLLSRSEHPRPPLHELHIRWILEQFLCPNILGEVRKPLDEMLRMKRAFDLDRATPNDERQELIAKLLNCHVIPCFELYQTEQSVRRMVGHYKTPLRAQMFSGIPKSWWPKDQGLD